MKIQVLIKYEHLFLFTRPTDCPTYWRRMEANDDVYCLKTTTEFLTWQQARDKCASYGADLLSICSPGENMFVNNELRLCGYVINIEWGDTIGLFA